MSSDGGANARLRSLLAGVLAGTARGLSAGARAIEQASWILRPREPARSSVTVLASRPGSETPPQEPGPEPVREAQTAVGEPGPVMEPQTAAGEPADREPTATVPDDVGHARRAESHIAELADRTAAEVVAEVPRLSTDELGLLHEHESTHKKRKTVLRAIERAAEPTG